MSDRILLRRRMFLGAAGAVVLSGCRTKPSSSERVTPQEGSTSGVLAASSAKETVPKRTLGKTGVMVSMVGLGGFHLGKVKDDEQAIRMVHSAIDRGLTFMDNCWDYNEGRSEELMGKALADGHRQEAFLMTKLDGRTKGAALEQLEQSLKRLKTDMIDLVQVHEVIRESDPARCFADGGCIEALLEAKKAGKLRFIGFTGHKDPEIHLAMLKAADDHGFRFDAVQMPLNVLDAHYRSFEKKVLPMLVSKNIGVLGMKPLAAGKILETKRVNAIECLHYAMSLPTSVVITGCDSPERLEQAIEAAVTWKKATPEETTALLDRTKDLAADGKLERFKTTTDHDGTTEHPRWLETANM